jgi:hypothetical protein
VFGGLFQCLRRSEVVKHLALLSLAVVLSTTALAGPPEATGTAKGRVFLDGPEPRQPCPGRTVYLMRVDLTAKTFSVLSRTKVTTDHNGEWSLDVPPGRYVASVVKDLGALRDDATLSVTSGATTSGFKTSITEAMCKKKK